MAALITLEQAKMQVRVPESSSEYDEELELKREQATAIVIDYLDLEDAHDWEAGSPTGSPNGSTFYIVQAAILEVLTNLWRHRGDAEGDGPVTARVVNMLRGVKTPVIG